MAEPIQLHPGIRERKRARVTASALADYILSAPDQQDVVLHDERYSSAYATPKYSDARRLICAFSSGLRRDWSALEDGRAALVEKSNSTMFTPAQREEAARCAEVIELFTGASNAFGVKGLPLILPAKPFDALNISGTTVSIQPDLLVGLTFPPETGKRMGLIFLRMQKRPDPEACKKDDTKAKRQDYRREMAKYMLVMGELLLRDLGLSTSQIDRERMAVWDMRLGEAIGFPSDRLSREKRIKAACGHIARLWASIQPKPNDFKKPAAS